MFIIRNIRINVKAKGKTRSTTGTKEAPDRTGLSKGSTTMTLIDGFCSFRYFPAPENVPPVPAPAMRISTFPAVSFHISGPDSFLRLSP